MGNETQVPTSQPSTPLTCEQTRPSSSSPAPSKRDGRSGLRKRAGELPYDQGCALLSDMDAFAVHGLEGTKTGNRKISGKDMTPLLARPGDEHEMHDRSGQSTTALAIQVGTLLSALTQAQRDGIGRFETLFKDDDCESRSDDLLEFAITSALTLALGPIGAHLSSMIKTFDAIARLSEPMKEGIASSVSSVITDAVKAGVQGQTKSVLGDLRGTNARKTFVQAQQELLTRRSAGKSMSVLVRFDPEATSHEDLVALISKLEEAIKSGFATKHQANATCDAWLQYLAANRSDGDQPAFRGRVVVNFSAASTKETLLKVDSVELPGVDSGLLPEYQARGTLGDLSAPIVLRGTGNFRWRGPGGELEDATAALFIKRDGPAAAPTYTRHAHAQWWLALFGRDAEVGGAYPDNNETRVQRGIAKLMDFVARLPTSMIRAGE